MPPLELVIFDCDGVLVDSERIAVRIDAELLAELGWPLSEQEVIERFMGRTTEHMLKARNKRAIPIRVEWRDLLLWVNEPMPVILIVYDVVEDRAYWLHVPTGESERARSTTMEGSSSLQSRMHRHAGYALVEILRN